MIVSLARPLSPGACLRVLFLNFDFSFLQKGFPPPLEEVTIRPFPFWRPFGVEHDVGLMAIAALARGDGGEFGSEVECLLFLSFGWTGLTKAGRSPNKETTGEKK